MGCSKCTAIKDQNMNQRPVLITLTSPTASGKSYLLNYIRDVAKLPCLVSTTTRPPRVGEQEGRDYHFISLEQSQQIEADGGFAELAHYRGVRYGVTWSEFLGKLNSGMAFLIVEPGGIDHYVAPAISAGARHLKYFVNTPLPIRVSRFKQRMNLDLDAAISAGQDVRPIVQSYIDRLVSMLSVELEWEAAAEWDGILDGQAHPQQNIDEILQDVRALDSLDCTDQFMVV